MDENGNTGVKNVEPRVKFNFAKLLLPVIILTLLFGYLMYSKYTNKEEVHYHAGFQVYVDNVLQDFSDDKYMTIGYCGEEDNHVDPQLEKAHLHDSVGDVVHIHRSGAKWSDLFININYSFDSNKNISAYVNGEKVEDIFNYPIQAFDSIVIFVGDNGEVDNLLESRVDENHIKEVEAKSESCGS